MPPDPESLKSVKDLPQFYGLATYAWVVALSVWGGVANFFRKLKSGQSRAFNIAELIGELAVSSFAGVITFLLCESAQLNPLVSAALVGLSGHMGSRAIFTLEKLFEKRFTA